jgi:exosome complex exonuclease DIS3/RRP44
VINSWPFVATLKDDAAQDSDDEDPDAGDEVDAAARAEARALRATISSSASSREKRPTGKIVGIIKRNWRPYVPLCSI